MKEGGKRELLVPPELQRVPYPAGGEVMVYEVQVFRICHAREDGMREMEEEDREELMRDERPFW